MRLTEEQYGALQAKRVNLFPSRPVQIRKGTRQKFNAVKTVRDGKVFASKGEADRYAQLELLQKAGKIRNLQRQVKYDLVVNGVHIGSYTADATYEEKFIDLSQECWLPVTEDFKGERPREWARTKKLMLAIHGIDVREVR